MSEGGGRGEGCGEHDGGEQVAAAADLVGLHVPGRHHGGQFVPVGEAEVAEVGERSVWRGGIGVQGRVVAGQRAAWLPGEQVVDGGEHQVRQALAWAGVRGDGEEFGVAGDPAAQVRVQGRVVPAAAPREAGEHGGEFRRPGGFRHGRGAFPVLLASGERGAGPCLARGW